MHDGTSILNFIFISNILYFFRTTKREKFMKFDDWLFFFSFSVSEVDQLKDHPENTFVSVNRQIFSTKFCSTFCGHLLDHVVPTSRRFPFIPSIVQTTPWGVWDVRFSFLFYKFIVYYTLLKLLCLFIVFFSFFTTTPKGYKRKDENKVFCLH